MASAAHFAEELAAAQEEAQEPRDELGFAPEHLRRARLDDSGLLGRRAERSLREHANDRHEVAQPVAATPRRRQPRM
jgi:hypothetical protein